MTMPDRLRMLLARGLKALGWLVFLPPLLTRLLMGQAFYQTGSGKLAHIEGVVGFFATLGIPFPALNAAFVARVEYYGGIALVLGLLTRLAAAGLASTMVVALMTADRESLLDALSGAGDGGLTDVVPLVFLAFLLWLVIFGPGPVSLDAALKKWLRLGAPPPEPEPE